jgi:Na+-translocating ferredoxin:NAD+ oxidoreductase RnfC subunit
MQELAPYNVVVIYNPSIKGEDEIYIECSHFVLAESTKQVSKGLRYLYKDVQIIAIIFGDKYENLEEESN